MSSLLKKPVNVIEFNQDPVQFLRNLLYPIKPKEIKLVDATLVIVAADVKEKGRIYGRERSNLKRIQDIISKYFPVTLKLE